MFFFFLFRPYSFSSLCLWTRNTTVFGPPGKWCYLENQHLCDKDFLKTIAYRRERTKNAAHVRRYTHTLPCPLVDNRYGMDGPRGGTGGPGLNPLENHKWPYVSLEILVRTPPREAIRPLRSSCFSRGVRTAPCEIRCQDPIWIHACMDIEPDKQHFWA